VHATDVIPAKAGIQTVLANEAPEAKRHIPWIPAFAGMTNTGAQTKREVMSRREAPKT
jgi:hypothetical protein